MCRHLVNCYREGQYNVGVCEIKNRHFSEIHQSFVSQFPQRNCVTNNECPFYPLNACHQCRLFQL